MYSSRKIKSMKVNADFTKVLGKEHEEKWVALSKDKHELVDFAETLIALRDRLGDTKDNFVYMRVLRSDMDYSFIFSCKG